MGYPARLEDGTSRVRGVGTGAEVPVVVGLLGILKAGAAYLPLDLAYPAERVQFILDDAGARLLVSHSTLRNKRPAFEGAVVEVDDPALGALSSANPPARASAGTSVIAVAPLPTTTTRLPRQSSASGQR